MSENVKLENGKLVMTKEISNINDGTNIDIDQLKIDLRFELNTLLRQMKGIKTRALEIQELLKEIDNN